MIRHQYFTMDVFTDELFGGNPLAVFPNAEGLSDRIMGGIAGELNLSETVFVFPPRTHKGTRLLRIFTPKAELPFAGHPTVGAAYMLALLGEVPLSGDAVTLILEEQIGLVQAVVHIKAGRPVSAGYTSVRLPEFGPAAPATAELAAMLSIREREICSEPFAPRAVSCGVPFLFVPVYDHHILRRVQLDTATWERVLGSFWAPHLYAVVPPPAASFDVYARMFAPALGITEDPATGAAATALAGYLTSHEKGPAQTKQWLVHQGVDMGRPSQISVEAELDNAGGVTAIRVKGRCVPVAEAWMKLPDQ